MGLLDGVKAATQWGADKAEEGTDWATDKAQDGADWTVDKVEDSVKWGKDKAEDGAIWALGQSASGFIWANNKIEDAGDTIDALSDPLNEEQIRNLEPNSSISLDTNIKYGGGVLTGGGNGLKVTHNEDGTYTVRDENAALLGIGFEDFFEVGATGGTAREYSFDNVEDAIKATEIIEEERAKQAADAGIRAIRYRPDGPPEFLSPEDQAFLDSHLSLDETGVGLYGEVGIPKVGLEVDGLPDSVDSDGDGTGLLSDIQANVGVTVSKAVEYHEGEPIATVETLSINDSASLGSIDIEGFPNKLDLDANRDISIQRREVIEEDGENTVEYSLEITAEAEINSDRARTVTISSGDITSSNVEEVVQKLSEGDLDAVGDIINLQAEYSETDIERDGIFAGFFVGEAKHGREIRDLDEDSVKTATV